MPSIAPDVIRVAVAILENSRHRFLVTRRPQNKHQGGKWEFPGGKIDADETVPEALARELREELGITMRAACPLLRVRHDYPDKTVLLDVWRVTAHNGEPYGREGQPLRWVDMAELERIDLPDADRPIMRALQLAPLYCITDTRRYGKTEMLVLIERALQAGARLFQLREAQLPREEFVTYARSVIALAHHHGACVLLNADPALVEVCGADGVHLSSRRLMALTARPLAPRYQVAASCHNVAELVQSAQVGADFALLSPVMATASHPGEEPLGWDEFARLRMYSDIPLYALGGMRPEHLPEARRRGAHGLAMIGGIWEAPSISEAVQGSMR